MSASSDIQQSGIEVDEDGVHEVVATKDNVDGQVHSHDGLLLTATNTAGSLFSFAEDGVAAPFTTRRDIHFIDSPKNHLSSSTKVCLFVYYSFVETYNNLMFT